MGRVTGKHAGAHRCQALRLCSKTTVMLRAGSLLHAVLAHNCPVSQACCCPSIRSKPGFHNLGMP